MNKIKHGKTILTNGSICCEGCYLLGKQSQNSLWIKKIKEAQNRIKTKAIQCEDGEWLVQEIDKIIEQELLDTEEKEYIKECEEGKR